MKFYRYDIHREAIFHNTNIDGLDYTYKTAIQLTEYTMVKETPKGYWIDEKGWYKSYWVSKTGKKRHAYPTKEEAMSSFLLRTKRRRLILKSQLQMCDDALKIAHEHEILKFEK